MVDEHDTQSKGGLDRFLDHQIEKRIQYYIQTEATRHDGSIDEALARRIRWEVGRRGETGKQLDIYEPMRWTGIKAIASIFSVGGAKVIADHMSGRINKMVIWGIEAGVVAKVAIDSAVDLTRLYPRWLAGMEGGKNTALKLHHEFSPAGDDPTFSLPTLRESSAENTTPKAQDKGESANTPCTAITHPVSLLQRLEMKTDEQQHSL